jgi:ketosteroid isomerase-like protein
MKTHLIIVACALVFSACTTPATINENEAAAKRLFDAFNRHAWDEMTSVYAENASFLDPSFGKDYVTKSRKETAEKYAGLQRMFPNLHDEVVGIYPADDVVTVEFVATGTMNDSINFKLPIISVLTFKDGLIVKDATYYDLENP